MCLKVHESQPTAPLADSLPFLNPDLGPRQHQLSPDLPGRMLEDSKRASNDNPLSLHIETLASFRRAICL